MTEVDELTVPQVEPDIETLIEKVGEFVEETEPHTELEPDPDTVEVDESDGVAVAVWLAVTEVDELTVPHPEPDIETLIEKVGEFVEETEPHTELEPDPDTVEVDESEGVAVAVWLAVTEVVELIVSLFELVPDL